MVLPSSHVSLPERLESPHVVLQTLGCAAVQLNPHSTAHPELQPSPAAVLPSSHPSEVVLIPFPQTSVQLDLPHGRVEQVHPISDLQFALHPSPLMVLPSSHVSEPASLKSPHLVLQTCLEVAVPPVQLYPHSILQEDEQPSPAAVFPSSQKFAVLVSFPTLLPSPHLSVHTDRAQV
jgi:hypothetical protein